MCQVREILLVHELETGAVFRKHPEDMDYFLHRDKNILSSSL
jgi:hypothetical protein